MSISIVIALIVIMLLTCIIGLLVSGQETSSHVQTLQKDIDEIENLLPQTQCRDCGFNGCRPYAEAIANRVADINRCLPGGIETIRSLSVRTGLDVAHQNKCIASSMLIALVASSVLHLARLIALA
jgi:electron transport complex protein RnfB